MSRKRKNKNQWWYWLGMVVVVALIVTGVVLMAKDREEGYGGSEPIPIETVEGGNVKPEEEEVKAPADNLEKEEVPKYDGEDPNQEEELSGVITYAGVSGGKLMIRVNIDQYLETGSCELTLKKGDVKIYNDRVKVVGAASTATCEGFDVPLNKLGEGTIDININLQSGGKTGTIKGEAKI